MAKLMLKKHQRALVNNFEKFSMKSIEEKTSNAVADSKTLLQPLISKADRSNIMAVDLS